MKGQSFRFHMEGLYLSVVLVCILILHFGALTERKCPFCRGLIP